jgi:acetyl-CoA carboxylase biotin carboxyl carrier protein
MWQRELELSEGATVTLSADDIKALIAEFKASDWEEMSLTAGDVSVVISRTAGSPWIGATPSHEPRSSPQAASGVDDTGAPRDHQGVVAPVATADLGDGAQSATADTQGRDTHAVTSPTVGLFWRSPQPGSPPFVEVGQRVEPGDTVAIVEVMKLINPIEAGCAGTVVEILPDNGSFVEHGSVLVRIEADS